MGGLLIVLEGPEGAGKSTQGKLLSERLEASGQRVVLTREPGGTPIGERIRSVLLDHGSYAMLAETEALLYAAARAQHIGELIRPALSQDRIVICDRFVDSSYAYQGGGRGLPMDALRSLQRLATGGLQPDLRLLLDLPVAAGLRRRRRDEGGMNRLDATDLAFHERVRGAYLRGLEDNPNGWCKIDASESVDRVAASIATAVEERLGFRLAQLRRVGTVESRR